MNGPDLARERALKDLAAKLMFDIEQNGSRYALCREAGLTEPFQSNDLTLDEAEEVLNTWKLRGFHGG